MIAEASRNKEEGKCFNGQLFICLDILLQHSIGGNLEKQPEWSNDCDCHLTLRTAGCCPSTVHSNLPFAGHVPWIHGVFGSLVIGVSPMAFPLPRLALSISFSEES